MNGNEVLKLLDAGFTAEEIRSMQTPEAANEEAAQAGSVDPPSGAAAEDEGAPKSTATASTQEDPSKWLKDKTAELEDIISKLKKQYENYNVLTNQNDKPQEQMTGTQALATLVAPKAIYTKGETEK